MAQTDGSLAHPLGSRGRSFDADQNASPMNATHTPPPPPTPPADERPRHRTRPPAPPRRTPPRSAAPAHVPGPDLLASAFRLAAPNPVIDAPIIARALGLTEVQLERLVLRTYAVSARHLLRITRLDLAHDKLRLDPLAPVSEVATAYGFPDALAFGRAFVERYGCTPGEVRGTGGRATPWPRDRGTARA